MRNTNSKLAKIVEATGKFIAGAKNTSKYALKHFPIGVTAREEQEYQNRKIDCESYRLGAVTGAGLLAAVYTAVILEGISLLTQ